ncbi:17346_t:CDS:10, partial [Funneliformis geosporum]
GVTDDNQTENNRIFKSELLEYNDFEEQEPEDDNRNLRNLVAVNNHNKADIIKQVIILKKLEICDCIIHYFGLTSYDDKFYLVIEWAEYGNLRQNNFKASRVITDSTTNQDATLEVVRYSSPETLEKKSKYDTRCEVYSFGILLWEIAEEKIPFLMRVIVKSSLLLSLFATKAVQHDQNLRPQFSKIFTRLQELYKKDGGYSPLHSPNLTPINNETLANDINFNEYRLMSVDEAIKQHKLSNGNCELAYKCFEANAKLNDMKAKYFKAYYIQQSLVKLDMDQAIKDKLVADLYKEVADFGDSEAQLRYSNCLLKGIGVKKDLQAAAEYYTKAAENGQVIDNGDYLLIMQYANNGDLKNYLEKNYINLTWKDKKKLAFQIDDVLNYLHNENILHRDLHSKNIVIHDDNAKITDFGISKHMNAQNTTIHIGIFGRIPYVDPNKLNDLKFQYEKVSDIYSFGVLMWEISSGVLPFKDFISISDQELLIIKIINGYHEKSKNKLSNNVTINYDSKLDCLDIGSQYNLGYCYRFGIGVEKDEIKANEWYINSGTKKIYRFGDSYQFGIGNKDDDQKEYKWYIENTKDQYKVLFANLFISLKKKLSNSKHEDIITIIDDLSQNLHIGDNVSDVNQISSETRLAVSVTETDSKIISTDNNGGKHIKSILEEDSLFTSVIGTTEIEPFAVFLPLITEVTQVFNEIIKIYQTAEHNKKICGIFLDRVQIADTAVRNLKNRRDENVEFFTTNNLLHLQELVNVISKICKFVGEISQLTSLSKYIQAKNIENSVKELSSEFDSTIIAIQFSLSVDFSINSYKTAKEHEAILSDIKELSQYLTHIGSGITDENQNVSEEVVLLSALNKIMTEAKSADTGIFISELLDYYDFKEEKLEDYRSQTKVKKFKRKNSFNDFVALKLVADKNSSKGDKDNFKKHVTILKKLKPCDCIIQYFGLTSYDDKLYLVTGWAEYGNLREYYRNYKLDIKLKLRFALDIAKGLNFLNAVKVVHRDIRAENILITDRESARIANFRDSRAITDSTKNQGATLESVRYCAPEKLDKGPRYKYDTKCEVYSFGILLWEIGEGKIPYQKVGNDIIAITELVCIKKYREPFSLVSQLPEEYQELAKKAVHPDHNFRPQFSKIFTILQDLHQKVDILHPSPKRAPESEKTISKDKSSIINSAAFNYMSVDEAVKNKSDRELSYKCFEAYAKLNDKKAKYYKAYFIQQNYVKLDVEQTTKDKLIADLYKESADLGYPEAQLRYGYCLFKGNGAEKDLKKAAEYFTKSAENGQAVGMFNAATLYLSDDADIRDEVLGKKYMRLAVYKQHKEAAEYCKKHNIPL